MYITTVPNHGSKPTILLRESYRENGKNKKRTLANLTRWSNDKLERFQQALIASRGVGVLPAAKPQDGFDIVRTLPHGHVAAVLGTLRKLNLDHLISSKSSFERDVTVAMIVSRVVDPASKLAMARGFSDETLFHSLGEVLKISEANEDDLYDTMDWLLPRQDKIEQALATHHLKEGTLILYDTTSTYFEGRECSLAAYGQNKDGKKDKLQIKIGLLCTQAGCPVAVEVFEGNMGDPKTLASQIEKVRKRFKLKRVVWVGDRGILTEARLDQELKPVEGLEWITALRAPAIADLVERKAIQLSLFEQTDLAEITDPEYPGERLIVCRNPLLATQRTRRRNELLAATETELNKIVLATTRTKQRLKGQDEIGLRVGGVLGKYKMAKHFRLTITGDSFSFQRDEEKIAAETALDGIYVIRTRVPEKELPSPEVVKAYKGLSVVERAFRSLKTVDLKIRPIHHHLPDRVRAHVFLCMLAYYVEWHMRQALAPMLFQDANPAAGEARRKSVVAAAQRSEEAVKKAQRKKSEDGKPVHSFQTLLKDLTTIAKNRIQPRGENIPAFDMITTPTSLQQKAFDFLGVSVRTG